MAGAYAQTATFTAEELLGKPTDASVTINIVPARTSSTATSTGPFRHISAADQPRERDRRPPSEVTIEGLSPDTLYYYRMVYDADGSVTDGDFETRTEHTFRTQRAAGEAFSFTVTRTFTGRGAPSANTMTNILNEHPDFDVDMGDTFMIDNTTTRRPSTTPI